MISRLREIIRDTHHLAHGIAADGCRVHHPAN
jgi:hypothetical protein